MFDVTNSYELVTRNFEELVRRTFKQVKTSKKRSLVRRIFDMTDNYKLVTRTFDVTDSSENICDEIFL